MTCTYSNIIAVDLNLEKIRGDSSVFIIDFFEDQTNTVPFDLTVFAGTLRMQVKEGPDSVRQVVELTEGVGLTVAVNQLEIATVGLNNLLPAKDYVYDIEGVTLLGDRLTIMRGHVIIAPDVTR